jgi:hypothetical protein
MNVVDKIVTEWAFRCKKGYPDMNNPDDLAVFTRLFEVDIKQQRLGTINKKVIDTLVQKYPETFIKLASPLRIGNKGTITQDEFIKIINDTFNTTPKIHPPHSKENSQQSYPKGSSKYTRYVFATANGEANLILAGKARQEASERQEVGIITAINSVEGIKTVVGSNENFKITDVVRAEKIPTTGKIEPIADIQLIRSKGSSPYRISAKANQAPTIGGGGLAGMSQLSKPVTDFIEKFYEDASTHYKKIYDEHDEITPETDLYKTKYFKDVNRVIPSDIVEEILRGTAAQGGPVDVYYIGDMDHVLVGVDNNTVTLSGEFLSIEDIAKDKTLYIHMKKRAGSYYYVDNMQTVNGITVPRIFAQRPNGTTSQSKLGTSFSTRGSVVI